MKMLHPFRSLAWILCASLAHASQTYIVDAAGGPGVHFTDIPPAIAAAQAGDVLLVMPGDYSSFDLDRGLTILGYGLPKVLGIARAADIPAGEVGVIIGLDPWDLMVRDCAGTVIVQSMGLLDSLHVYESDDVRLLGLETKPPGLQYRHGADLRASRVEVVSSRMEGSSGPNYFEGATAHYADGGRGIFLYDGARVHLVASHAQGGFGGVIFAIPGSCFPETNAGSGGLGIAISNAELILAGGGVSQIRGGGQGWCADCCSCLMDGFGGSGIWNSSGSTCRWSAATVYAPPYLFGSGCGYWLGTPFVGAGQFTEAIPPDPVLLLSGAPAAGQGIQLTVWGSPGDEIRLHLGRDPVVVAEPPIVIELLTTPMRTLALGPIPSGGERHVRLTIPAALAPGARFFAQAELQDPSGQIHRTNSIPLVVR